MNTTVIATEERKEEQETPGNIVVSVIIPNYNHSPYLVQRIETVLHQTFRDFEIIILDDCSTDNSADIIKNYKNNPKIARIFINEENSGSTFLQWKKGIDLAAGEWIWIAESDDWCEASFLETLLKEVDDQTAIAFCQSIVVDDNNSILWQTSFRKLIDKLQGTTFFKMHWNYNQIINASMAIFRKEKYNKIDQFFLNMKHIGDWVFWLEMSMQGNVVISGKTLNYFRKHPLDVQSKALVSGAWHFERLETIRVFSKHGFINKKEENLSYKKHL